MARIGLERLQRAPPGERRQRVLGLLRAIGGVRPLGPVGHPAAGGSRRVVRLLSPVGSLGPVRVLRSVGRLGLTAGHRRPGRIGLAERCGSERTGRSVVGVLGLLRRLGADGAGGLPVGHRWIRSVGPLRSFCAVGVLGCLGLLGPVGSVGLLGPVRRICGAAGVGDLRAARPGRFGVLRSGRARSARTADSFRGRAAACGGSTEEVDPVGASRAEEAGARDRGPPAVRPARVRPAVRSRRGSGRRCCGCGSGGCDRRGRRHRTVRPRVDRPGGHRGFDRSRVVVGSVGKPRRRDRPRRRAGCPHGGHESRVGDPDRTAVGQPSVAAALPVGPSHHRRGGRCGWRRRRRGRS